MSDAITFRVEFELQEAVKIHYKGCREGDEDTVTWMHAWVKDNLEKKKKRVIHLYLYYINIFHCVYSC